MTAMYSTPASSAVLATVASSAPSRSGPRGVLKSGICKPIFIVGYLQSQPLTSRASAFAAHRAPEDRPAGVGPGFRAPFLDPHHPGRHEVHAREEPRHLLAAAGREPLLHRPARVVLEATTRRAVKQTRPHVGDGEVAAGRHGVRQPADYAVRVVG